MNFCINCDLLLFCGGCIWSSCQICFLYFSIDTLLWCLLYLEICFISYLYESVVFITCATFGCLILFSCHLPMLLFKISSIYSIIVLWAEIGPGLLGCQNWDQDHGAPENSSLQWILTGYSLHEDLFLNLRCTPSNCLHNPKLMPHATKHARQKHKWNHWQIDSLTSDKSHRHLQMTRTDMVPP